MARRRVTSVLCALQGEGGKTTRLHVAPFLYDQDGRKWGDAPRAWWVGGVLSLEVKSL